MSIDDTPVLVEVRGAKLIMTLNRPAVLNAQNQPLREALVGAIDRLEDDDELRVGILRGAGRAFSAGADLKELREGPSLPRERTLVHFERTWACDKPLIAAVHGHAAGGGCELAQLCDVRVATADAMFSQPEPRSIGRAAPIAAEHLHRFVGRGEAMLVNLTGRPITGERAYQVGLVQRLVAQPDELLPVAEAIADDMIECAPEALREAKRLMRASLELQLAQEAVVARVLRQG